MRLRGLDLFCGAGGASRGYQLAGWDMTGVDIHSQPRYCGDAFIQADVFDLNVEFLRQFAFIHASPPCQGYSIMRNLPWLREREYPLLIEPTRELLRAVGRPYVIENVTGAQRKAHMNANWLCGTMFGLRLYRHRVFESSFPWWMPGHCAHRRTLRAGRHLGPGGRPIAWSEAEDAGGVASWQNQSPTVGVGHAKGWRLAARAMGIDWMTHAELTQAIPPAYTHYLAQYVPGPRLASV